MTELDKAVAALDSGRRAGWARAYAAEASCEDLIVGVAVALHWREEFRALSVLRQSLAADAARVRPVGTDDRHWEKRGALARRCLAEIEDTIGPSWDKGTAGTPTRCAS